MCELMNPIGVRNRDTEERCVELRVDSTTFHPITLTCEEDAYHCPITGHQTNQGGTRRLVADGKGLLVKCHAPHDDLYSDCYRAAGRHG